VKGSKGWRVIFTGLGFTENDKKNDLWFDQDPIKKYIENFRLNLLEIFVLVESNRILFYQMLLVNNQYYFRNPRLG